MAFINNSVNEYKEPDRSILINTYRSKPYTIKQFLPNKAPKI